MRTRRVRGGFLSFNTLMQFRSISRIYIYVYIYIFFSSNTDFMLSNSHVFEPTFYGLMFIIVRFDGC
jgi:hypothetical protein